MSPSLADRRRFILRMRSYIKILLWKKIAGSSRFRYIEGFLIECRKPKPKQLLWPITREEDSSVHQSEFEVITCNRRQARENARVQVAIGFGFVSHWLRKWHDFFRPITGQSKAKPKQARITFDTQVKTALISNLWSQYFVSFCSMSTEISKKAQNVLIRTKEKRNFSLRVFQFL